MAKEQLKNVRKKTTKDNKEVSVTVEEIENGFLVTQRTEWSDPKTGWECTTKKYYSEKDPFEEVEDQLIADLL